MTESRQPPGRFGYQPALDGMRALAVSAVLLFHGLPAALPGGFLGVDAFFVLSGFLITALLLAERERTGRIRLGAFWMRRARRLLPALLLMIAVVLAGARWLVAPQELAALRADALAAVAYVANWRMIYRGGGYFEMTAAASPLQHTWSLGIEEQFYLLWPLLVLALRSRRAIALAAGAGALASAGAAALLFDPTNPDRAYFGTDTRAAALLVGCAVAAGLPVLARVPRLVATGCAAVALVAVAIGWVTAQGTSGWLYRGGFAALAAAVALLLADTVLRPRGPFARLLALPPLVGLGRISYGVYLWHWPLFGYLTGARTGLTGAPLFAVRVAVTLAVAAASFLVLERPILRGRRLRWSVALPATACAAAAVVALIVAMPAAGPPTEPDPAALAASGLGAPPSAVAPSAAAPPVAAANPPAAPRGSPLTRPGRMAGPPRVLMLGDSVAWTLGEYMPLDPRIWFINGAVQGCGIARLPDIRYLGTPHTNYPGCTEWDQRWRATVQRFDPDVVVVLLDRWELMDRRLSGRYQHVGDPEFDQYLTGELNLAWSISAQQGARVVMLTAPYTHRAERPDGSLWDEDTPQRTEAWNRLVTTAAAAHASHPTVLDLLTVVCPDGHYTATVGGLRVRSDGLHFTPPGVRQVIAPWLLPQMVTLTGST